MLDVRRYEDAERAVLMLRIDEPETECIACGAKPIAKRQGLPMYDGEFLENDHVGEWGGFDACEECHRAHTEGGVAALNARLRALRASEREQVEVGHA